MNGPEKLSHICSPALSSAVSVLQSVVQHTVHRPGKGHLLTIKCMEYAQPPSNNSSTIAIMEVDSMFQMKWGLCPRRAMYLKACSPLLFKTPWCLVRRWCTKLLRWEKLCPVTETWWSLSLKCCYSTWPPSTTPSGQASNCFLRRSLPVLVYTLSRNNSPNPLVSPTGSHVLAELKYKIPQADKEVRRCPLCSWAAAGGDLSLVGKFQGKFRPLPSSPSDLY